MHKNHISICVCTYKRPLLLDKLLNRLVTQRTDGLFNYSVVIVDNDAAESARDTVLKHRGCDRVEIAYALEPVKNISLARNRSIRISTGELIALIDDDEYPEADWLVNLYKTYDSYGCSGVMGPVFPIFEENVPYWVRDLGFLCNKKYKTGAVIDEHLWAGNALISKKVFNSLGKWFEPVFGHAGSEDNEFFNRALSAGHKFIWCEEAGVYSVIPRERTTMPYLIRRSLGIGTARYMISNASDSFLERLEFFAKTFIEICRNLITLPFCQRAKMGERILHIFWLLGRILACCNIVYKHYK